jgi:hypothetical protein
MLQMGRRVAAATAMAGVMTIAVPATASADIEALPNVDSQFRKGSTALARSIAVDPKTVRRGTFSMLPPGGRPAAISTTRLAGFPRHGRSFAILSNGDARYAGRRNTSDSFGRGAGGPFVRGARDVVIFRIDLRVPRGANCLSLRFRYLTEEFPEFVNSPFNDAFIAETGSTTWTTASNEDPTISAPGNFAATADGKLISVNASGDTALSSRNARGTTYDGATRILRASTPIRSGSRKLYLSIFDQGDRQFDSAVFLDRLELDDRSPCQSGAVGDN